MQESAVRVLEGDNSHFKLRSPVLLRCPVLYPGLQFLLKTFCDNYLLGVGASGEFIYLDLLFLVLYSQPLATC